MYVGEGINNETLPAKSDTVALQQKTRISEGSPNSLGP